MTHGYTAMLRFLGLLVLISLAFAAGYVFGQLPLKPLTEKVRELSKNVMDTTLGIERDLRRRQGLVDAKARLVQAKLDLAETATVLMRVHEACHQQSSRQGEQFGILALGLQRRNRVDRPDASPVDTDRGRARLAVRCLQHEFRDEYSRLRHDCPLSRESLASPSHTASVEAVQPKKVSTLNTVAS